MNYTLYHGDCLDHLKTMSDSSIDSIVTDPPYGLSFMGKKWDYDVPSVEIWAECLRVLKPGGHLLAFAGTRTQHRMAVRIEDAGFEIRDMIAWVYGSGFPKSRNLAGDWKGWGSALKPALEPITVARKPLISSLRINVESWGVGALNIDDCRISSTDKPLPFGNPTTADGWRLNQRQTDWQPSDIGRWPANLIHDGSQEVLAQFPDAPGQQAAVSANAPTSNGFSGAVKYSGMIGRIDSAEPRIEIDKSSARFFYCAKISKADRNEGCEQLSDKQGGFNSNTSGQHITRRDGFVRIPLKNNHPTVKPTDLMRYLCRLVTPPGGTVLDPFMGSGSTGKAALLEGFSFIGIEREAEYIEIARARLTDAFHRQTDLFGGAA